MTGSMEYEAVVVKLSSSEALRVLHELERFNPLSHRRGNRRSGGRGCPYSETHSRGSRMQFGDITLGSKNVLSLLAQAALLGQKGAYFHKWQVHRRLRPECFAGRNETHPLGHRQYDIHTHPLQFPA